MEKNPNKNWPLLICLALALTTLAVFCQVYSFKFITIDDPDYVYKNLHIQSGLTLDSVKWAFTAYYALNWHPLTWLSHILDWQLYGSNPAGHHLTNLFFHIANTLLLFLVLKKMTSAIWQSAFVAALFALHPLHVESVAWVAERKDVLSTFFWLLTMAAFLRYVRKPGIARYLLILLVFALGLMAKPMLVTLPFVLLLLDYWPLNRISRFNWRTIYWLILEKVPLFLLTVVSSVITFIAQHRGRAVASLNMISIEFRVYNAFISYLEYIGKMFWPARLACFYPHPAYHVSIFYAVISAVILLAVTIFILRFSKEHRYLFTGWFWYVVTLLPVIGLVQVGSQAMADRYTYISLIGLFIIIAWSLPEMLTKWPHRKAAIWISSLICISILAICTYYQTRCWKDTITLGQHALKVTEHNYKAHFFIAEVLLEQGRIEDAYQQYSQTVQIKPDYADAIDGLGVCLCALGRIDEAIGCYEKALKINPLANLANANYGVILATRGNFDQAVKHFRIALETMDTPRLHNELGDALLNLGQFDKAAAEYEKILLVEPNNVEAHNDLGVALSRQAKYDQAIAQFNQALRINPAYKDAKNNLSTALTEKQKSQGKNRENAEKQ